MALFERDVSDDVPEAVWASVCASERGFTGGIGGETACSVEEERGVDGPYAVSFVRDVSERDFFLVFESICELCESPNAHFGMLSFPF